MSPSTTQPRIRTKIHSLEQDIDDHVFTLVSALKARAIDVTTFQRNISEYFRSIIARGRFEHAAKKINAKNPQEWFMRRHIDECRYALHCFYVADGEVHPPHHHHNVVSTQIVMRGRLHLREYDRVKRTPEGTLLIRVISDKIIKEGDVFQASEWKRNAHWFAAVDGPAIIFNMNARGFEQDTFATDADRFGRLYLDPTRVGTDGLAEVDEFDEARAQQLFQGKRLDQFALPEGLFPSID